MAALFVIVDRCKQGVGLARSDLTRADAERICAALQRAYPAHRYTVEPQRYEGRGRARRVAYPSPDQHPA